MVDPVNVREFGYGLPVSWVWMLMIGLCCAYLVFRCYLRERGKSSLTLRIGLASIRTLICWLVLLSMMNWHVVIKRFRRSEFLVCLDASASLQHLDQLPEEELQRQLQEAGLEKPTRLNVLKFILDGTGLDLFEHLRGSYSLKYFAIGSEVRELKIDSFRDFVAKFEADEPDSRIDRGLQRILKRSRYAKPSGILLFTDGLDSEDPRFRQTIETAQSLEIPIYPVGLGGNRPAKDLQLEDLQANRKVFLNDLVEFRLAIAADGFANQKTLVQLIDQQAQEIVAEKELMIPGDQYRDFVRFRVRMAKEGKRDFVARLRPLSGEYETDNNQKSLQIEVNANQIKVLLASNYPSREFHFLKQFLGRDSNVHPDSPAEFARNRIELSTFLQQGDIEYTGVDRHAIKIFPVTRKQLFEYDVVIFCDLKPNWAGQVAGGLGKNELSNLREFVEERGGGLVMIAGPKYTPEAYVNSPIENLIPVDIKSLRKPESTSLDSGSLAQPFSIRKTAYGARFLPIELGTDETPKSFLDFPGSFWFATSQTLKPQAIVLAELLSGGNSYPGIMMQKVGNGTVLYHSFPETYRWRYRTSEIFFGRYWSQMIQYLASAKLTAGDQAMILETDRRQYYRKETVQVLGHLLDRSLANQGSFAVTIRNRSDFSRRLLLQRSEDSNETYSATIANLGPGTYEVLSTKDESIRTEFEIADASRENQRKPLNEAQLENLARETGGTYLKIENLGDLEAELPKRQLIEIGSEPPWTFWKHWQVALVFGIVILILITTEWLIRKKLAML